MSADDLTGPQLGYFARCGREFDVAISVLTGGPSNTTVSTRCARAQERGERAGIIACDCLDVLVQDGHCEKCLTDQPTPVFVYLRAGVAFAVPIILLSMAFIGLRHALHTWL